jgi:hypothetical protein
MEISDAAYVSEKLLQFKSDFQIEISPDWGEGSDGTWQKGKWVKAELDKLYEFVRLFAEAAGGSANFIKNIGGARVLKTNIGSHGGEAVAHLVRLSDTVNFDAWTIVHEFAHAWDANCRWQLSVALEKYTGGSTNYVLGFLKRLFKKTDSGLFKAEKIPGRYGRLPGANAFGYFYGDKPGGADWNFNRREDFAECVAMYVGWNRNNALSAHAHARVERFLLPNEAKDNYFGQVDNWEDYAPYFYPEGGDYSRTKRWQFIDGLVTGRITLT